MKRPIALITGASSGIGAALAEEYAKLQWNLVLIARREEQLLETALSCKSRFPSVDVKLFPSDVSTDDFAAKLSGFLKANSIDALDAVYVNAGVGNAGRFEKIAIAYYRKVFDTNVFGAVQTVQGTLQALKTSRGKLVIVSSINGHIGLPLGTPYNMSKFAVRALGQSLYYELAPLGVQVSIACPGPVKTEIVAIDNDGRPVPEAKEFFADKPALPAALAARRMISKVHRGKREFTLSLTTDFLLFMNQHFPSITARLIRWAYRRYEKNFVDMIAKVNPNAV